jgi:uncharacterized protein (TIGR00270 family)
MGECEMCGMYGSLKKVHIEGTELSVCPRCAKHGSPVRSSSRSQPKKRTPSKRTVEQEYGSDYVVRDDVASILKREREKRGKTQKEMAIFLKEKESILHKIESGHYPVNVALAKKFQSTLHIPLIIKEKKKKDDAKEVYSSESSSSSNGPLTFGDLIKKKK